MRKYFILLLIICILNITLSSCYASREITSCESLESDLTISVNSIELKDGKEINYPYSQSGYVDLLNNAIVLVFPDDHLEKYELQNIKTISSIAGLEIKKIEMMDGLIIDFEKSKLGYGLLSNKSVVSFSSEGNQVIFSTSEIIKYLIKEKNFTNIFIPSVLYTLLIGTMLIILIPVLFPLGHSDHNG